MDKILAKVGSLTVSESEIDEFLHGLGQRGAAYNNPEGRKVILEQLIGNKLLLQDARRNLVEGEAEFRAQLARLKDNLLISYVGSKIIAGVTVSDAEIESYYAENKDKFVGEESVNASHILVSTSEEALEILAKIKSGEMSFEERMGCGFGACMGCSCKTVSGNKRICKEGPVLSKEDIIWEA